MGKFECKYYTLIGPNQRNYEKCNFRNCPYMVRNNIINYSELKYNVNVLFLPERLQFFSQSLIVLKLFLFPLQPP